VRNIVTVPDPSRKKKGEHMITVVNKNVHKPCLKDVYIGRGPNSPLGNPFIIPTHGTRSNVVAKYVQWLTDEWNIPPRRDKLMMLAHRANMGTEIHLVCFCAPLICHGDIVKTMIGCIQDAINQKVDPLKMHEVVTQSFSNYFNK
jgi:hypothetical protein